MMEMPNNPGTVEDLHKACQSVFPMYFEGAKVLINKGLSSHFQVSHTVTMSSMQPSGYRFGKYIKRVKVASKLILNIIRVIF